MYTIKERPEDFVVRERAGIIIGTQGEYTIFLLKKRNYTTLRAVEQLSRMLRIPAKHISFAGNKDKRALTEQYVSIFHGQERAISIRDIELLPVGKSGVPLSLGSLEGNEFAITVRNANAEEISTFRKNAAHLHIPNYFGEQRFSSRNADIGKLIVQRRFAEAVQELRASRSEYLRKADEPIAALRAIPRRLLKLYVHAYQSLLWNRAAREAVQQGLEVDELPIIGFAAEKDGKTDDIIGRVMEAEGISSRDFIIRQLPDISAAGGTRRLWMEVKDFRCEVQGSAVIMQFFLGKGSYATTLVRELFQPK